jgi:hypothetical protein
MSSSRDGGITGLNVDTNLSQRGSEDVGNCDWRECRQECLHVAEVNIYQGSGHVEGLELGADLFTHLRQGEDALRLGVVGASRTM